MNRECTNTENGVNCGDCVSGYTEMDGLCVEGV